MPYIAQAARARAAGQPDDVGELTYAVTQLVNDYLATRPLRFSRIAEAVGALECAKLELYRRVGACYEDGKLAQNGDVYTVPHTTI